MPVTDLELQWKSGHSDYFKKVKWDYIGDVIQLNVETVIDEFTGEKVYYVQYIPLANLDFWIVPTDKEGNQIEYE